MKLLEYIIQCEWIFPLYIGLLFGYFAGYHDKKLDDEEDHGR